MNRNEAIEILNRYDVNFEPHPAEAVMHAIDMAITALEQPECEDAISREDTVDVLASLVLYGKTLDDAYWYVKDDAPSVTPKRKTGKWLMDGRECGELMWRCSECKVREAVPTATAFSTGVAYPQWHYCPNCGAEMKGDDDNAE